MAEKASSKKSRRRAATRKSDASPSGDTIISAQVVLKPTPEFEGVPATAATIAKMMPPPDVIAAATREFRRLGFDVGPVVGYSFSVTESSRKFESAFHTRLPRGSDGQLDLNPEGRGYELPLGQLSPEIRRAVQAVVFTPPPDFGPGGGH
jgi:hypothetical protein